MASLFFLSASAAVAPSVTTPICTCAKSGLAWTSPVPVTVTVGGGRVPGSAGA